MREIPIPNSNSCLFNPKAFQRYVYDLFKSFINDPRFKLIQKRIEKSKKKKNEKKLRDYKIDEWICMSEFLEISD